MNTVVVTGANRGIGLALSNIYAYEGNRVIACCRNPDKANKIRQQKNIELYELELLGEESITNLSRDLNDTKVNTLINNAGIWGPVGAMFGEVIPTEWQEVFRVNTMAPLLLSQALLKNMKQTDFSVIANISSNMGSVTLNSQGSEYIYRSSKAALNAITKSMAIDLKRYNIAVVAIHPGWVKTDMGGKDAKISPEESAKGIKAVLDSISIEDSGKFIGFDGEYLPW